MNATLPANHRYFHTTTNTGHVISAGSVVTLAGDHNARRWIVLSFHRGNDLYAVVAGRPRNDTFGGVQVTHLSARRLEAVDPIAPDEDLMTRARSLNIPGHAGIGRLHGIVTAEED